MHRLATAVVVVVMAFASSGCSHAETGPITRAEIDFRGFPDGAAPLSFGPGEASLRSSPSEDAGAQLRIVDGKLTNMPVIESGTAGYYTSPDLGGTVTDLGARWVFTPRGGTPGTMAMLVSQSALDFPFAVHLVITPGTWSFGVWPPHGEPEQGLQVLQSEAFTAPLAQDGVRVHEARVKIEGERVAIDLPDGQHRVIRDPRIAAWSGHFATFEAFSDHGLTDSRTGFTEIWAFSRRVE